MQSSEQRGPLRRRTAASERGWKWSECIKETRTRPGFLWAKCVKPRAQELMDEAKDKLPSQ